MPVSRANIWKELICSPPKWIYLARQEWLYLLKEIFSSHPPSFRLLCWCAPLWGFLQLRPLSSTFASNASHLPTFSSSALIFTSFISLSTKKAPIYIFSCTNLTILVTQKKSFIERFHQAHSSIDPDFVTYVMSFYWRSRGRCRWWSPTPSVAVSSTRLHHRSATKRYFLENCSRY